MIHIESSVHGVGAAFGEWNPSNECFRFEMTSPAFTVAEDISVPGPDGGPGDFFRALADATIPWGIPLEWSSYSATKRFLVMRAECDAVGHVTVEFELNYMLSRGEVIWRVSAKYKTEIGLLQERFLPLAEEFGRTGPLDWKS